MNPAMTLMPLASIVLIPWAFAAPCATEAILPPRTTMEPDVITVPFPAIIRALVMARSCAGSAWLNRQARKVGVSSRFICGILRSGYAIKHTPAQRIPEARQQGEIGRAHV